MIRKYDVFKELTKYADGDLSLGECIDNCPTLDIKDLFTKLEELRELIYKQEWGYRLECLESLDNIIDVLKEWVREDV